MSETRGLLRERLRRWGVTGLSDTAELLATELLTNALQHTGGGAVLTATLAAGAGPDAGPDLGPGPGPGPGSGPRLRVEVQDSLAGRPRLPPPGAVARALEPGEHSTSGRGLLLVQVLADAWGAQPCGTGKVVWFELCADPAGPAAPADITDTTGIGVATDATVAMDAIDTA